MPNGLPDFRIGLVVRAEDQTLAVEGTNYAVARELVSFGAVYAEDAHGNIYACAAPWALATFSAHLYPSLAAMCATEPHMTVEALDRHERYDLDGDLIAGYRILQFRAPDLTMQEAWSLEGWLADLGLTQLSGADAEAARELDDPPSAGALAAFRAGVRAGLSTIYGGVDLDVIADKLGTGRALLDVLLGVE
jgi:hypothetical protein